MTTPERVEVPSIIWTRTNEPVLTATASIEEIEEGILYLHRQASELIGLANDLEDKIAALRILLAARRKGAVATRVSGN